jgi:trimethylamine--corrinoid protein Co-methyltransferase
MTPHPRVYLEQLDPEQVERVRDAALDILDRVGLAVLDPEALRALADAGARVQGGRARFTPDALERLLAPAPRRFLLHGRNPVRTVEVGSEALLVSPGYGSPSVADTQGRRRDATLADVERFSALAGAADCIDITGGLIVEPLDVPPRLRPLEVTRALIEGSDKPFLGSVDGAAGARESIEMARIAADASVDRAVVMGLVNINSPLRLDARMAEALLAYARAGQAVLLTPGIMMGVTAPVTAAGAAAQALAELLACVALVQAVRPGAPVVIGTGGFGADLRTGGPGFGRPENALGTTLGAQLARRLGLPFRCSGAVTGSRLPDCRSGYERMMTAMAAWAAGAHLCLQGAGTLDSINSMSYEQFAVDVEIWGYLKRLASRPETSASTLAVDLVASLPPDYLGSEHTVEHLSREMAPAELATPKPYDEWLADGGPDVVELAAARLSQRELRTARPPLEDGRRRELERYVGSRRKALG